MGVVASKDGEIVQPEPFDPSTVHVAPKIDIPLDEEDGRFVKSFTVDQPDQFLAFFEEYGFVVVRDVLSAEECRASIDDLWNYLETRSYKLREWAGPTEYELEMEKKEPPELIKRDDPSTWDNDWPPLSHAGILGYLPVFTKQALANRQNVNIYSVFKALMKRKDLMVSHDRYGMFRPVMAQGSDEPVNERWKTSFSLHWDLNPWRHSLDDEIYKAGAAAAQEKMDEMTYEGSESFFEENNEVGTDAEERVNLQGLINFADNLVEDGGFQTVVGFHKHMAKWAETTKNSMGMRMMNRSFVPVDCDDPLYNQPQRVSMRAGSIVIWDQRMAHGSAPNRSPNQRFCQFMKMSPALDPQCLQAQNRAKVIQAKVDKAGIELSDMGKSLFGLKPWQ